MPDPADNHPAEWLARNLGSLLPLLLLFLGWVASSWRKMSKQAPAARPSSRAAEEEAERTRQVREQVRRRIAERQPAAPAPAAAPPVERRLAGGVTEVFAPPDGEAAERARQERLAREIAALGAGLPPPIATHQAYAPPPASPPPAAGWLETLRDPLSARRAIVVREILGRPVALR
jgi:hypothetical protein